MRGAAGPLEERVLFMDLREATGSESRRHPWELSRLGALKRILRGSMKDGHRVLDLGCGDGFISRELFSGTNASVSAVDSNFTKRHLAELSARDGNITYARSLKGDERFDLVLLLDVIEHVDKDLAFLRKVVKDRLAEDGRVLMTVPAFNSFFSSHDRFLGHRRRYSLKEFTALSEKAGLKVLSSGYLFSSLLLPRALAAAAEKALGKRSRPAAGVGNWRLGAAATAAVKAALDADNAVCLALSSIGVRLPGLTAWVLCERQR